MIEPADKYQEQLEHLKPIDGNEWYYYNLPLNVVFQCMVSIYNGEVIGSIGLLLNLAASTVLEIPIMIYSDKHRFTFGKDVMMFIRYLMQKYRKCSFPVLIGSPEETHYDRLTKHMGWKTVG
ncbi:MAG: hypothetical protein LBS57_12430, partial [Treponema sp.]|nr:hypothetical protein [Treponema sp.]